MQLSCALGCGRSTRALPLAAEAAVSGEPAPTLVGTNLRSTTRPPGGALRLGTRLSDRVESTRSWACAWRDMEQRRPRFARRSFVMNGTLCGSLGTGVVAAGMDDDQ
jgi:hypothetical protein